MIVKLHVAIPGILPLRREVEIEVPEKATVEDALEIYAQEYKNGNTLGRLGGISILVNDARGSYNQELKENDRVKIFKALIRG